MPPQRSSAEPGRMRAAIYARLSRSTEESTSIERQVKACRAFAESRGYDVVLVSDVDVDVSGGKLARPGLDDIRRRWDEIDVLLFFKLDRLSRSLLDFVSILEEARESEVALVSATEPLDLTSPIGEAMVKVLAIFAELERKTIAFRVTSAIAHLRSTGRIAGGPIPYGMKKAANPAGAGYVLAVDDDRAVHVLEMVDRVLAGESYRSICQRLNERGIPTPRGLNSTWRPNTIRAILQNPSLWGAVVHQGQIVRGEDGMPRLGAALVSRDTWDSVQLEMARRGKPSERNGSLRQRLLSGLLVCDHCGVKLGVNRGGPKTRERTYTCPTKGRGGNCVGVAITAARIEEYVEQRFLAKYGSWSMSLPVFFDEDEPAGMAESAELKAVETALSDLETDRYERGLFPGENGARRFADMYQRLEARRDVLLAEVSATGPAGEPAFEVLPTTMGEHWVTASMADKRTMLIGLLGSIRIKKGVPGRKGLDPRRVVFERGLTNM